MAVAVAAAAAAMVAALIGKAIAVSNINQLKLEKILKLYARYSLFLKLS
jgi:hypothetical protein